MQDFEGLSIDGLAFVWDVGNAHSTGLFGSWGEDRVSDHVWRSYYILCYATKLPTLLRAVLYVLSWCFIWVPRGVEK